MQRYIFITGGVVSSLGKGLASAALGALMHVGQPERLAGEKAGERAKSEGVTKTSVRERAVVSSHYVKCSSDRASARILALVLVRKDKQLVVLTRVFTLFLLQL